MNALTRLIRSQALHVAEKYGEFRYGDAQGDKRVDFAADLIEAHERVRGSAPELLEALQHLLSDIEGLMSESEGVYGLHRNGDPAPWEELDEGGGYERLSSLAAARAAIAKSTGQTP